MSASVLRRSLSALALLLAAAPLRADTLKVPADFDTIQDALDAAQTGDTVLVSKGIYRENLVTGVAGITIKGKGATINGGYTGDCLLVTAADVTVEGFTLVNGGGSPIADGIPAGGLHLIGSGASISKLTVSGCEGYGIFLQGTGEVEKCTVDACVGPGIAVETNAPLGEVLTTLSRNTATRCDIGIVAEDGPFLIEKNVCEHNADSGLELDLPALEGIPPILGTTVSKNEARYNTGIGLDLTKVPGPTILVEKNVSEFNDLGMLCSGFAFDLESNTLEDNVNGGLFFFASDSTLAKNKVRGNGKIGIIVSQGAAFDDGATGNNLVQQNTVQDNGGDGILLVSDGDEVVDNVIKDNAGDGVDIDTGLPGCTVVDNTISNNAHDGIDNSGSATLISGNVSKGNGGADLAGAGDGPGTVDGTSEGNVVGDGSDFTTEGELELVTVLL